MSSDPTYGPHAFKAYAHKPDICFCGGGREAFVHSGSYKQPSLAVFDPVNKPKHYNMGGIECIDAIKAATIGLVGIEAVDTAQVMKYIWRWKFKNGVEDLQKAKWYLEHLIKEVPDAKLAVIAQEQSRLGDEFHLIAQRMAYMSDRCEIAQHYTLDEQHELALQDDLMMRRAERRAAASPSTK